LILIADTHRINAEAYQALLSIQSGASFRHIVQEDKTCGDLAS
jgi:hypothetical protein